MIRSQLVYRRIKRINNNIPFPHLNMIEPVKPPAPWPTDEIRQLQKRRETEFRKDKRKKCLDDFYSNYKILRTSIQ